MIDFRATLPHYVDHLLPIWEALPPDDRGTFWSGIGSSDHCTDLGIDHQVGFDRSERIVVVAAYRDQRTIRNHRKVLVEHGIGQSYGDLDANYTGGSDREHLLAILSPNLRVTEHAPPGVRAPIVGTPKLDRWFSTDHQPETRHPRLVVSFHWNCDLHPETQSAWYEYEPYLERLNEGPWELWMHAHPRIAAEVHIWAKQRGIHFEPSFDRVMEAADLYAVDNSSTLYEFAATGKPVIVLNASFYRRTVEHGLRFWEFADVGVNCDDPDGISDSVFEAMEDTEDRRLRRKEICQELYPIQDGSSAGRCASYLLELDSDDSL